MSCYDKSFGIESIGFCCAFALSQYEVADEIWHDKLQKMSHLGLTKISIHLFTLEAECVKMNKMQHSCKVLYNNRGSIMKGK